MVLVTKWLILISVFILTLTEIDLLRELHLNILENSSHLSDQFLLFHCQLFGVVKHPFLIALSNIYLYLVFSAIVHL